MGSFAAATRNSMLNAFARNTAYSNASVWVRLHTGLTGTDGTANAAANTTRQSAAFTDVAASGSISNTSLVEWTNVSNTETYSDVSLWTASTAGTFLGEDTLSSTAPVTAGDTFRIPIGDLDLTVT